MVALDPSVSRAPPRQSRESQSCTRPASGEDPSNNGWTTSSAMAPTELGEMGNSNAANAASYVRARSSACPQSAAMMKRLSAQTGKDQP